jgi:hypothetical protein
MSPPGKQRMGECINVMWDEGHTHDHRWVCRVSEERNMLGLGYNVCPAELHIHSDVDVKSEI